MSPCQVCGDLNASNSVEQRGAAFQMWHCINTRPSNIYTTAKEGCRWCGMLWRGTMALLTPRERSKMQYADKIGFSIDLPRLKHDVLKVFTYRGMHLMSWPELRLEFYVPEGQFISISLFSTFLVQNRSSW